MDPNSISMLKTDLFSKLERTVKKYRVNTQKIRTELILDLKALADFARGTSFNSEIFASITLVIGTVLGAFFGVKA